MYFVTFNTMPSNSYATALKKKGKPLFIPFVVLGDPDMTRSVEIIRTLVKSGADALELGFPFSDPPADGPVIQEADVRALKAGIRIDDCFEMLKEIRQFTDIPIGLLAYYNLVLQRGVEKFYRDCAESGVVSVLIADLPLEHSEEIVPIAKQQGIAPVFLVSEITTDERLTKISDIAEGYLYVVSYLGVTGVCNTVLEEKMRGTIEKVRRYSNLPLIVGFGINNTDQASTVLKANADGLIIGSRIVKEALTPNRIPFLCKEFLSVIERDCMNS